MDTLLAIAIVLAVLLIAWCVWCGWCAGCRSNADCPHGKVCHKGQCRRPPLRPLTPALVPLTPAPPPS